MALNNFANLKENVQRYVHREDVKDLLDDMVLETEQEIFFGQSPIRIPELYTQTITSSALKTLTLPDRLMEFVNLSIKIDDDYYKLQAVPKVKLPDNDETGVPCFYSITNQIEFDIEPDKAYNFKLEFYQSPLALSDANPTNAVLTKYPLVYKFGMMASAFMYAGEEDKSSLYASRMRDVISTVNTSANNMMYGENPIQIIDGAIP